MYLATTIPEDLLGRLRDGATDVLLAPILEPGKRTWHGGPCERFLRAAALLEEIGWQSGEAGDEIVIDLFEHADALRDALGYALPDALRDLREAEATRSRIREGAACAHHRSSARRSARRRSSRAAARQHKRARRSPGRSSSQQR
jgi:hypothetical protein